MQRFIPLVLILSLLLPGLGGCYNRVEMDDTVGVTGFGVDIEGDQKVLTVQVASPSGKPEGGGSAKVETMVLKESASGFALAARQAMLRFPRTPAWSLATTMLIGEPLAQSNMELMIDFISRNRFIRPNMLLFLSVGNSPEEILQAKTPPENYSAQALVKMIQNQESQSGIYLPVTIRDFRTKCVTPGVEPVLPQVRLLEMDGEKVLQLHGTAVFRGKQMVGALDDKESRGLRLLDPGEKRGGLITVNLFGDRESGPLEGMVTMEIIRSRSICTPRLDNDGKIYISIVIEADGNLYEQTSGDNLQTTSNLTRLEELTSQAIERDALACVHKAQTLHSDIFGWGTMISRQYPELWQKLEGDWPSHFASVQVEARAKYSVRRTYLLEEAVPIQN